MKLLWWTFLVVIEANIATLVVLKLPKLWTDKGATWISSNELSRSHAITNHNVGLRFENIIATHVHQNI